MHAGLVAPNLILVLGAQGLHLVVLAGYLYYVGVGLAVFLLDDP